MFFFFFNYEGEQEELILFFETDREAIDANIYGSALIAFDQLYRAINSVVNPGWDIEIEFVRSDTGSLKTLLKSIKKDAGSLAKSPISLILFPFLLNIISNWASSDPVTIIVDDKNYIVQKGSEKILLPRAAAEKAEQVERSPNVRRAVKQFFAVCEAESSIKGLDFRSPGVKG